MKNSHVLSLLPPARSTIYFEISFQDFSLHSLSPPSPRVCDGIQFTLRLAATACRAGPMISGSTRQGRKHPPVVVFVVDRIISEGRVPQAQSMPMTKIKAHQDFFRCGLTIPTTTTPTMIPAFVGQGCYSPSPSKPI